MQIDLKKVAVLLLSLVLLGRVAFNVHLGTDIPISGQSLVVLLIGYYLNYTEILLVFALYFGAGSIGLPVFADGSSGWQHFLGKSGGYLYAFPLAAIFIKKLLTSIEIQKNGKLLTSLLLIFLAATCIILFIGMVHLSSHIGLSKVWTYGVVPYLPGGLIKAIVAVLIIFALDTIKTKFSQQH